MSKRVSVLAIQVEDIVRKCPHVTSINLGRAKWCRGKTMLKVIDGTPRRLLVQICEKEGQRDMHVYTKNCAQTIAAVKNFAEQERITFVQR